VIAQVVNLAGTTSSVTMRNTTADAVDLSGWHLCQFPDYWPLPPLVLAAGATVTAHVGSGESTDTDLFSNGAFGTLGASGEIAIYSSQAFDDSDAMVSYVGWGAGGARARQAAPAGLWEFGVNLKASEGDALVVTSEGAGLATYTVKVAGAAAAAPATFEPEGVAIVEAGIGGPESTVVLQNFSDETVSLAGWYLCNVPAYWGLPDDVALAPGETILIDFNAGGPAPINAGGALGELTGGAGEIALYRNSDFGSSDGIVSYVGWNGGKGRKTVAQGAGIWGDEDVTATDGDILRFTGAAEGAAGYDVT